MAKKYVMINGIRVQEITAIKHWRLTTIGPMFMIGRVAMVVCKCECGTVGVKRCCNLTDKGSRSCGCFHKEQTSKAKTKHGCAKKGELTPAFNIWVGMVRRVTDVNHKSSIAYLKKGRNICSGYREFATFFADVGERPSKQHSIDRRENNGHYSCGRCEQCVANGWPMNIRWATKLMQANNTSTNRMLTFYGKTMSLADWSRVSQIDPRLIWQRLNSNWSEKDAVWKPVIRQSM